ncbi:hypothetical protein V8F20_007096 [Naviculisporaceae sp. PSN 640]
MATTGSSLFAIIRLILHVVAVVVAVLTFPYLAWIARHARQSIDEWIVMCIVASWSAVLNIYEATRQGFIGICGQNPRLLSPSLGHCIGAHIVTLILLIAGFLTLAFSNLGRESGTPVPPDYYQLEEEERRLMTSTLIAVVLACILQFLFSIFACVDYHKMRRKRKLEKAARRAANRSQSAGIRLQSR